ncbi:MAG TPA: aspartate 1-decarboxylase [Legionellales bacterium]|nr:aspartate 1-decarboxylase [Legionellales bacterium]
MLLRQMLNSKIHRATITAADINYEGSITIPPDLILQAKMYPSESVHIWNVTAGTRFQTYILEGLEGSNDICVNGAAARLVSPGDKIIIASFVMMPEADCQRHQPTVVFVDDWNQIKEMRAEKLPDYDTVLS